MDENVNSISSVDRENREEEKVKGRTGFGINKKEKKKGKNNLIDEAKIPEPAVPLIPKVGDDFWGAFGGRKDVKKSKKEAEEVIDHDEDIIAVVNDPDLVAETGWGIFGDKKEKENKKGKAMNTDKLKDRTC